MRVSRVTTIMVLTLCFFLEVGCHGENIGSHNAENLVDSFLKGNSSLERNNPIALPGVSKRREWYNMYSNKQWPALAKSVLENGYDMDISWFLLGESAFHLGYMQAARIYFEKSIIRSNSSYGNVRCANFPSISASILPMCLDFRLPLAALARLQRLH